MAVKTLTALQQLTQLTELQIHQIALKNFHYHSTSAFPYNLLIGVLHGDKDSGDFLLNVNTRQKVHMREGHVYIIPCHSPVQYERTPQLTVVTIRFNLSFFHGLDIFAGCRNIEEIYAPHFTSLFLNDSYAGVTAESADQLSDIKSAFTIKNEITSLCLSRWPLKNDTLTPKMWKYEAALLYAKQNVDATLTVAHLADIYSMRQDVFSRAFRRDLGISPKQYIADVLLREISSLLLTSHMSIKEISEKLKFSSPYYMSRFFKKHTQLSPSDFKKQFSS